MPKEIRSSNVERGIRVRSLFRRSDFGIRSDFVIRHSSFVFGQCGSWEANGKCRADLVMGVMASSTSGSLAWQRCLRTDSMILIDRRLTQNQLPATDPPHFDAVDLRAVAQPKTGRGGVLRPERIAGYDLAN